MVYVDYTLSLSAIGTVYVNKHFRKLVGRKNKDFMQKDAVKTEIEIFHTPTMVVFLMTFSNVGITHSFSFCKEFFVKKLRENCFIYQICT